MESVRHVVPFMELGRRDVGRVGGKNASLGEPTNRLADAGVRVPPGFATTAEAYGELLDTDGLRDLVRRQIDRLHEGARLDEVGAAVRSLFLARPLPAPLRDAALAAYEELAAHTGRDAPEVAVRSSATAEDLPEASFAGQQETYLNVRGPDALLEACARCYASLFTDRAIDYRERMGFDHLAVALSVGVQIMVRSDLAGAGVVFTLDPESGFPDVTVVSAAWGLGETVVSGRVDPDEYTVFKPSAKDPALDPVIDVRTGSKRLKTVYAEAGLTRTVDEGPSHGPAPPGAARRRRPARHRTNHRGPPRQGRVLRRPAVPRHRPHRRLPPARPVVVRTSDSKTNEYAKLLGGRPFEPDEANPMIGWRGASRYYSEGYREGFALECRALRRVRDTRGLTDVVVMFPFCRTLDEADRVLAVMAEEGLVRGENGLCVYVMAEIPADIVLAEEFAERFDGFFIGSNDLTQLTKALRRSDEVERALLSMGRSAPPGCGPVGPCGRSRRHCTVPETERKSGARETRTRHRPRGTAGPPEPRTGRTR
ncbi:PEP/pyruvate-binding domain-containing protein [Streptomyces sp. NPDC088915]|uniref:PEP/pyruvate-binding domain-containing protein n=1 Tax=Streptomyces sp. NPDC088915 TaxID=3365912 RepID=UPI003821A08F